MENVKNVQRLDDSMLAEVSGGVEWKAQVAKEAAGNFFATPAGILLTVGGTVAIAALSVLATIFLPKTPKVIATIASKGWLGEKAQGWGAEKLKGYGPIQQKTAADFHVAWGDPAKSDDIPEDLVVVANG